MDRCGGCADWIYGGCSSCSYGENGGIVEDESEHDPVLDEDIANEFYKGVEREIEEARNE